MNKLLLIIDLQNDFINSNTKHLKEKINNLMESKEYNNIVFTQFINTIDSKFVKDLNWEGCLTDKGKEIAIDTKNNYVLKKDTYTCLNNELREYIQNNNIDEIYICGIDTECCILKTAFDLFENSYDFYVLKDYCACTYGKERHYNSIEILTRNIGIKRII